MSTNVTNEESTTQNTLFIDQTTFNEIFTPSTYLTKNMPNIKLINQTMQAIPKDKLANYFLWLGNSSEVLKSRKNAIKYDLTTMTNDNKALGNLDSFQTTTTVGDYISTRNAATSDCQITLDQYSSSQTANVGFPITKREIDDLLIKRLSDSLGKQSPVNGKTLDLRSYLNANVLPVVKNNSLTNCHRILETALAINHNLAIQNTNWSNIVLALYDTDDLASEYFINHVNNPKSRDYFTVCKATNLHDQIREACVYGAGLHSLAAPQTSYTYLVPTFGLIPYNQQNPNHWFDLSPIAREKGYNICKFMPLGYLLNMDTTGTHYIAWCEDPLESTFGVYGTATFTSSAARDAVEAYLRDMLGDPSTYDTVQAILNAGTVTIGQGQDAVTYTWNVYKSGASWNVNIHIAGFRQTNTTPVVSGYQGYENPADIINAIDWISKVQGRWNATTNGNTTPLIVDHISLTQMHLNNYFYHLISSSFWGRLAMLYGQAAYTYYTDVPLGDQSLLNNKIFNHCYYLAGLKARFVEKSFGSYEAINSFMMPMNKHQMLFNTNVAYYKACDEDGGMTRHIPLLSVLQNTSDNITFYNDINTANVYPVIQYFSEARWWRYDYFGSWNCSAPNQRVTANTTDQEFDENTIEVYTNANRLLTSSWTNNIDCGIITCRFGPNGAYTPLTIRCYSKNPNTVVKFTIPKIFKNKKRVKTVLLHGFDLTTTPAPVYYTPYENMYELVDNGNFADDQLDELF